MIKIIFTIIFSFLVALAEVSFVWSLPFPANLISIIIPVLIFYIVFGKNNLHWIFIVTVGVVLDVFDFMPIGFYIVLLIAAYYIGRWIYFNYFASPSFVSVLLLSAILVTLTKSVEYFIDAVVHGGFYEVLNYQEFRILALTIIVNIIFMAVFYWIFRAFVRIFKLRLFSYERI